MDKDVLPASGAEALQSFIEETRVEKALISSVKDHQLEQSMLPQAPFPVYTLSSAKPLPFKLQYATPDTLGLDRIALASAAFYKYPAQDVLVIDAGTAITYDLMDRSGTYRGGAISPGLQMRYQALKHFTARLPLVEHKKDVDLIGDSTKNSIRSGVRWGVHHEIMGTIEAYRQRYPQLIVVLTGGDAGLFDETSKNGIFAAPDFILHGLNHILEYYADKA